MEMYKSVGNRIRCIRKQKNLTQQKLAEMADISLSFLGHIERGTRKMSLETFYAFTAALDCSADELLGTGRCAASELDAVLPTIMNILESAAEQLRAKGKQNR